MCVRACVRACDAVGSVVACSAANGGAPGAKSLQETAARVVVSNGLDKSKLTTVVVDYINSANRCSYCHGYVVHVRGRPPQTQSCSLTGGLVVPAQAVLGDELSVLVDLAVRPGAAARSRVLASVRGPPGRSRCTRSCNVKQDNFRIFFGRSGRAQSPSVRSHSRLTAGTHRR